jgi:glucosamine-6-phosphate deaminase
MPDVPREFVVRRAAVHVCDDREALGRAAADHAAILLRELLARQDRVRLVVACGPSQAATLAGLAAAPDIEWRRVHAMHMDEYVGLPRSHPASLRRWLDTHLAGHVDLGRVDYLDGDAPDPEAECLRYARLLRSAPIDLCLMGIGENGHIAFNDPAEADFDDPRLVKIVTLDEACRTQQTAEGHFPTLADVPPRALTLTCPALLGTEHVIVSVPGPRKADAVRKAIRGPRSTSCPASAIMDHARATVYLDRESASQL